MPASWVKSSTELKINAGSQDYAWHWWRKDYSIGGNLFRSYYALGHGEQAIIVVPEQRLVLAMTAGNYMEPEHRHFEIMADYILPSVKAAKVQSLITLADIAGIYRINDTESIKLEARGQDLFAIDPNGTEFRLQSISAVCWTIPGQPRVIHFIPDENGDIVYGEIFIKGIMDDRLEKITD